MRAAQLFLLTREPQNHHNTEYKQTSKVKQKLPFRCGEILFLLRWRRVMAVGACKIAPCKEDDTAYLAGIIDK